MHHVESDQMNVEKNISDPSILLREFEHTMQAIHKVSSEGLSDSASLRSNL